MIQNLPKEQNMNNSSVVPAGASPAVFNNPEFGSVRVIMKDDGEPLFCLKDVCGCLNLSNASVVASRIDSEEVTKLNLGALEGETTFVTESGLYDVSKVKDMSGMFQDAKSFNQDLSGWNVSNVTNMSDMFAGCYCPKEYQPAQCSLQKAQPLI